MSYILTNRHSAMNALATLKNVKTVGLNANTETVFPPTGS